MVQRALHPSALVPTGFQVESAVREGATTVITARAVAAASACPGCGGRSWRAHSRYVSRLADLPLSRSSGSAAGPGASFPLRRGSMWPPHLHRTVRWGGHGALGAPHRPAGPLRSSSRAGPGWSPGSELCPAADDVGEQLHTASGRTTARLSLVRSAAPPASTTGPGEGTNATERLSAI